MFNAKLFLNHLDNGGQAIGRARCVSKVLHVGVIGEEFLMIASQDHVERTLFLDWRRNDHLFDPLVKEGLHGGYRQELSRALHDHFNVRRNFEGLECLVLRELDRLTINDNGIVVDALNVLVPSAMHAVILDQIRRAFGAAQIIYVHHFEGGIVPGVPQDETADPAVAVQQAFRCHRAIALLLLDEGTNE